MVSLNIDGHQVQLVPSAQQNVLNIDSSHTDFIQLPYTATDQFHQQQQLTAASSVRAVLSFTFTQNFSLLQGYMSELVDS